MTGCVGAHRQWLLLRLTISVTICDCRSHLGDEACPVATMIVSGGQGPDEPIPESLAMKRYLIANGVPEQQIIMEYQSTNTFENIKNTKDLLATYIPRQAQVVCVTSQFHVLRALRFGQILNVRMTGLGSTTPYHFLEIALIRDFLGLMYQYRLLLTVYFAILFFICIISFWQIPSYL